MPARLTLPLLILLFLWLLNPIDSYAQQAPTPKLAVLRPTMGEVVSGSEVAVKLAISAFKLTQSDVLLGQAGKQPEANQANQGHIQLRLDLGTPMMLYDELSYTFTQIQPGQHTLEVRLVENDHSPLDPPVSQEIEFTTVAAQTNPTAVVSESEVIITTSEPERMPHTAIADNWSSPTILTFIALTVAVFLALGSGSQTYGRIVAHTDQLVAQFRELQQLTSRRR